jgi:nucleoside 2-deoxyribosyltransferase
VRVFLAHSIALAKSAKELADKLEAARHEVIMPCSVDGWKEIGIFQRNAHRIKEADVVFAVWDGTSDGTPMDVAMSIALGKPVYVKYPGHDPAYNILSHVLLRAWCLFAELPSIESFLEKIKTPAATQDGE